MTYLIVVHDIDTIGYRAFDSFEIAMSYLSRFAKKGFVSLLPAPSKMSTVGDDGFYYLPFQRVRRALIVGDPSSLPFDTGLPV